MAHLRSVLFIVFMGLSIQAFVPGAENDEPVFFFFWGVGCPHCEDARPFAESLKETHPDFEHRWYEVKKDEQGREVFKEKVKALKIEQPGIPAFICNRRYVIGFTADKTDEAVRRMLDTCRDEADE